ncbi:MAG TPA: hypothetical protein VKV95_09710 [Terriglobia bacterium]|nr:hypothetical protein [Terriglobia bacterium]
MKAEEFTTHGELTHCSGGCCPKVYKTDRGTFVVQGMIVDVQDARQFSLAPREGIVEIPEALVIALADKVKSNR